MTNRLADTKSLYLRKHTENPIDWWPWCDEALETARAQNKPIFLSIGYSSCHWCTVMEGEAFSDLAIAQYMNANFLPIKVDREERPDLDSIYMQSLQMMTGQGGWPLNAFLSPDDLVPFYAGTYFPVDPRYGRPGFLQVLQALRNYYDTEKEELRQRKALILEALLTSAVLQNDGSQEVADQELLQIGWEVCTGIISPKQVGNSFPMIPYGELVLRGSRFNDQSRYDGLQVSTQRGLDLALGGIYDHVAGGFHRYTVDPTWTVPHFEKMLYDNGQIVEYLADLWSAGIEEPAFKRAVAGTVKWLQREMTALSGYFYAAQDADSFTNPIDTEPEEGAFYVWSYQELQQLLTTEELTELEQQFTVSVNGNFEGKNVLQRLHPGELSETLEVALSKLFTVRYGATPDALATFPPARDNQEAKITNWPGRIPAVTDTKMIVAWNSLMISGLARAGEVFQEPSYLELAIKAAKFILDHQFVDGRFHRLNYEGEATVLAQSEDYALFIKALLDLQQADLENADWLEKAIALQDEFNDFLWSVELGGYFNTSSDNSQDLIIRERSFADNATPSANGVAIANLVRLSLLTDNLHYLDLAESGLKAFKGVMNESPQGCASLFTALDWYRNCTLIRSTTEQIKSLMPKYLPTTAFSVVLDLPDGSVGLVCQGLKCLPAPGSLEELLLQVQRSQNRG
ncbi:MAG: thioredoxin domain-containing protein [Sphaerospermopsis kisseleviana]|uniref:thioredoxin domain-containing protein n=1 Tax=unclassified Sphaerospermopsis TaxID=2646443 RepID=UPI00167FF137|nr:MULTISPECIES: thioredoxin domain-containing protein [unclassified Sphaerospermopsis]MBD2132723.1 thioredoxin domain-containing protein [Sphaerospermopsis sp. FACHB-1094]MBD2145743.1 thioredoxin domain-containing protein [Sphaerospermopsis sp. FACHB-1194]